MYDDLIINEGGVFIMEKLEKQYQYILMIACGLAASAIGLCNNAVGVFYTTVSADLGVLRGTFALHATLALLAQAIMSLFVPALSKKYRFKPILLGGIIVSAVSTMLMSRADRIEMFYVLGVLRGLGVGLYGTVPIGIIVNQWFQKKNGTAMGIALSFSGLSGAVASPLLSILIQRIGWQSTYLVMGVLILVLALPAFVLPFGIRPEELGMKPYGYEENPLAAAEAQKKNRKTTFRIMQLSFILMCAFTFMHTSLTGITQHLAGYAVSVGLSETIGATLMSCAMIGNISTKLIIGTLSDKFRPVKACAIMMAVNACSLLFLMTGTSISPFVLPAAAFFFGSVYSVGAVGIPLLTRYFFGNENYASAYSIIGFFTSLGSSSSLTIIGYVYDIFGTYRYAFLGALCIHAVNACILTVVNRRQKTALGK
jgi:MFS family permease